MAFYGRFGPSGELLELLRNPSPVPGDAELLTKIELFTLLNPIVTGILRRGVDDFVLDTVSSDPTLDVRWPVDPALRDRISKARRLYELTESIAQEFIEQRLAIQMGSTEITSTRLPPAFGLKLLEFREKLRRFLSKTIDLTDQVPDPPDD